MGYDKSPSAIAKAELNVEAALMDGVIEFEQQNFFRSQKPTDSGVIVFNPPYGERLPHVDEFYTKIGDTLKKRYSGYKVWMITSDLDALKEVGLRAKRKIKLFNGSLECRLVCYEMYEGSKKAKFQKEEE